MLVAWFGIVYVIAVGVVYVLYMYALRMYACYWYWSNVRMAPASHHDQRAELGQSVQGPDRLRSASHVLDQVPNSAGPSLGRLGKEDGRKVCAGLKINKINKTGVVFCCLLLLAVVYGDDVTPMEHKLVCNALLICHFDTGASIETLSWQWSIMNIFSTQSRYGAHCVLSTMRQDALAAGIPRERLRHLLITLYNGGIDCHHQFLLSRGTSCSPIGFQHVVQPLKSGTRFMFQSTDNTPLARVDLYIYKSKWVQMVAVSPNQWEFFDSSLNLSPGDSLHYWFTYNIGPIDYDTKLFIFRAGDGTTISLSKPCEGGLG